ncbi:MAG: hypothetical protein ACP5I4_07980 [Oceanipulchritudo sp.]
MSFEKLTSSLASAPGIGGSLTDACSRSPDPVHPLPHTRTRTVAVNWVTPVYNRGAVQRVEKANGNGNGGDGIKYWEHYGSLAGLICHGPVDTLEEILIDSQSVWKGPLQRDKASVCSTIAVDPQRLVRFYWGCATQEVDPLLAPDGNSFGHEHPAYKGVCYIVLVNFLFGRERTSVPGIAVVVTLKPRQELARTGKPGSNLRTPRLSGK